MPRRRQPTREVSININDQNVRDALVLWVSKYHGIDLDIKHIDLTIDDKGKITATAARKPSEKEVAVTEPSLLEMEEEPTEDSWPSET